MLVMKKNYYLQNSKIFNIFKKIAFSLSLSWVIALSAQIMVPLPVIPVTLQNTAVMLIALLAPTQIAVLTIVLYFIQAVSGLPVLAGGKGGLVAVMGPTGGFLVGYIAMVCIIAFLKDRSENNQGGFSLMISRFCILSVGQMSLYLCGLYWMSFMMSSQMALTYGLYPFLFKIPASIVAAILLERAFLSGTKYFTKSAS